MINDAHVHCTMNPTMRCRQCGLTPQTSILLGVFLVRLITVMTLIVVGLLASYVLWNTWSATANVYTTCVNDRYEITKHCPRSDLFHCHISPYAFCSVHVWLYIVITCVYWCIYLAPVTIPVVVYTYFS